jgi:plastocyanin
MQHRMRVVLVAIALSLPMVAAACGGGGSSSSSSSAPGAVTVKDNLFQPSKATVKVGGTVTWTFKGNSAHNVTFDAFHSNLMKDGTYQHTFTTAGSFSYHCTVHQGMNGTVVVSDSAAP